MDGPPWAWRFVLGTVVWFLRRVRRWRVRARRPDVVPPPHQPLVVVCNHTSNVDVFLVADMLWRRLRHWCQPLAKAELFEVPVLGTLASAAGAIPVGRGEDAAREAAYDAAVARLREGGTVLVAPEGTTTHDGSLLPLRHGAARLALEAGVAMLVVTHFGAQRGFSPVVRMPHRGALVTMTVDLVTPWPGEDPTALTGRVAAIMLDRTEQLQAAYPQADPSARWWPPYSAPASPTATARENLERYRESMAETVAAARARMAEITEQRAVEERLAQARERAGALGERARHRIEELGAQARGRVEHRGWLGSDDEEPEGDPDAGSGPPAG